MASTLRSPSLIAIPPLAFVRNNESNAILIYHLGKSLCGHEGIVHGGIIATILDDSLARNVSPLDEREKTRPEARLIGIRWDVLSHVGLFEPAFQDGGDRIPKHLLPETDQDRPGKPILAEL